MRCCTNWKLREEEEAMGYWFIYSPNLWRDRGKEKLNGQVLKEIDRPIVYSLSPGVGATPAMAKDVSPLVNVYRVTGGVMIGGSGMDIRSKARTLPGPVTDPHKLPKWNFDGSSTAQARQ
ncbi:hypothetical protein IFM89_000527 [Coptis chinensis]|uniref:Uncharacterized protein n=1 Tax=Coptis chinensis TaxID=261450 RepID=A0A835H3I1_9MAGN|nr:hypothetical protein IFM89_000527 [Coptis chinensis]